MYTLYYVSARWFTEVKLPSILFGKEMSSAMYILDLGRGELDSFWQSNYMTVYFCRLCLGPKIPDSPTVACEDWEETRTAAGTFKCSTPRNYETNSASSRLNSAEDTTFRVALCRLFQHHSVSLIRCVASVCAV